MTELSPTPQSFQANNEFCSQLFHLARNALLSPHVAYSGDGTFTYKVTSRRAQLRISNYPEFMQKEMAFDNFGARAAMLHRGSVWLELQNLEPQDPVTQAPVDWHYYLGRMQDLNDSTWGTPATNDILSSYDARNLTPPAPDQPILYLNKSRTALFEAHTDPFLQKAHRRISGLKNRLLPAA